MHTSTAIISGTIASDAQHMALSDVLDRDGPYGIVQTPSLQLCEALKF